MSYNRLIDTVFVATLAAVVGVLVFACAKPGDRYRQGSLRVIDTNEGTVEVVHDDARGVTCWVLAGGVSCLPDSALRDAGAKP